jgi:hypothetical protein
MSEFQYYEFLAIDRPLSREEKVYVGGLSSRAKPSATRVVFTYSYSDFRHTPQEVLLRCFDLMVYMANWGGQRLMFRLPKGQVDLAALQRYAVKRQVIITAEDEYVVVDLDLSPEYGSGGVWIDETNAIADDLAPLRQDLLDGDYRLLYLAWLALAQRGMVEGRRYPGEKHDEGDGARGLEPPVPAGLSELSGALQAFVEWSELEVDLVSAAALASPVLGPSQAEPIEDWVRSLSEPERIQLLVNIASEDTPTGRQLRANLRERKTPMQKALASDERPRRSFAALKAIAQDHFQERIQRERAAAAKARRQYLKKLAPQEDKLWSQIAQLIEEKKAKSYDQAVKMLLDLRELAGLEGRLPQFQARFQPLLARVKPTSTLYKQLKLEGLIA